MNVLKTNNILEGDVRDVLPQLPAESVDCIVTSIPYWALRDYGHPQQIGMEATPELFIETIVGVFAECRRVLKKRGTCWINIADTYWGGKGKNGQESTKSAQNRYETGTSINRPEYQLGTAVVNNTRPQDGKHPVIKRKELCLIPQRLAIALQQAGWYIRQDIIWSKPNPMPEAVNDRCTKAHEYIWLLSKSPKYFFDPYAIGTVYAEKTLTTFGAGQATGAGDGSGLVKSERFNKSITRRAPKVWRDADGEPLPNKANKRSVWVVASKRLEGDHYAYFPEELIVDCIRAGCPKGGIVLDPFAGTGTTGIVAHAHDRLFVLVELVQKDVKRSQKRFADTFGMFNPLITPIKLRKRYAKKADD